jgi:hypothetical protein
MGPGIGLVFYILVIGLLGVLLPVLALIDIIRNEFKGSNKVIWLIIVLLLPLIGSILYFVVGKKQKS